MATGKKRGRIEDVHAKVTRHKKKRRAGTRTAPGGGEFDHTEVVTLVGEYFEQGFLPAKIQKLIQKDFGLRISREAPYRYLAHAAKHGWIHFDGPAEHMLQERLRNEHTWLQDVAVAHTAVFDDVAHHAAKMILGLLRKYTGPPYNKKEVHIGFAGGHAMRTVAKHLARLLREPAEGLPTAPNAFFTYFENDPALQVKTRLVGLLSPPIVEWDQVASLREMAGIDVSFSLSSQLDIIVTSAASWDGECPGMLRKYMKKKAESIEVLEKAGICADMLWRPLNRNGPIEDKTSIRAMTLMELSDLPGFIQQGKSVMLVLGPCRKCHKPRPELLENILQLKEHLVTHVAADSRSVAELLRRAVSREPLPVPTVVRSARSLAGSSRRRPK
ncbi:MAG: hypothetical protein ACYTGE_16080 [Planctomycetota bacterium]|jgi:hypothetical protein